MAGIGAITSSVTAGIGKTKNRLCSCGGPLRENKGRRTVTQRKRAAGMGLKSHYPGERSRITPASYPINNKKCLKKRKGSDYSAQGCGDQIGHPCRASRKILGSESGQPPALLHRGFRSSVCFTKPLQVSHVKFVAIWHHPLSRKNRFLPVIPTVLSKKTI